METRTDRVKPKYVSDQSWPAEYSLVNGRSYPKGLMTKIEDECVQVLSVLFWVDIRHLAAGGRTKRLSYETRSQTRDESETRGSLLPGYRCYWTRIEHVLLCFMPSWSPYLFFNSHPPGGVWTCWKQNTWTNKKTTSCVWCWLRCSARLSCQNMWSGIKIAFCIFGDLQWAKFHISSMFFI